MMDRSRFLALLGALPIVGPIVAKMAPPLPPVAMNLPAIVEADLFWQTYNLSFSTRDAVEAQLKVLERMYGDGSKWS